MIKPSIRMWLFIGAVLLSASPLLARDDAALAALRQYQNTLQLAPRWTMRISVHLVGDHGKFGNPRPEGQEMRIDYFKDGGRIEINTLITGYFDAQQKPIANPVIGNGSRVLFIPAKPTTAPFIPADSAKVGEAIGTTAVAEP